MTTPNSRVVAKRYVIRYQQTTVFTLLEEKLKYHTFAVESLRYSKTNKLRNKVMTNSWNYSRYNCFC